MELNGALSNPFESDKDLLRRLDELHRELLDKAETHPRRPRQAPAKTTPVLETISSVLASAARPMRAREIHAAAQKLAGMPLSWNTVKDCLHKNARRPGGLVERVGHGRYRHR